MAYRVEFTPRAARDLDELYRWVVENAPLRGTQWFDRLEATILSLAIFPERCPTAESLSTPEDTVRQLVFGRKRNRYIVYYAIFGDLVRILHVRHGARSTPEKKDLFR
jgi:plasmid stabilization system protein ParE